MFLLMGNISKKKYNKVHCQTKTKKVNYLFHTDEIFYNVSEIRFSPSTGPG